MPESVWIELTWTEVRVAITVGVQRRLVNRERSIRESYPTQDGRGVWDDEIESAGAELAVAKHFGVVWDGLGGDRAPLTGDVQGIEVRWTSYSHGRLGIHERDPDTRPALLVRGRMPRMELVGWTFCGDGKLPEHWRKDLPSPCWLVPAEELASVEELVSCLA